MSLTIPPLTVTEGPFKIVGSVDLEKRSVSINVVRASDGAPVEYTTIFPVAAAEAVMASRTKQVAGATGAALPESESASNRWAILHGGRLSALVATLEKVAMVLGPYVVKEWPTILSWAEKALAGTALAL